MEVNWEKSRILCPPYDENAMKRLQRMVAPFILRRCKNDVLGDLPDKMEESRYVQLEEEQRKLYDALR